MTIKEIQEQMAATVQKETGAEVEITFFSDAPLRFSMFTMDGDNYRAAKNLLAQTATLDSQETYEDEEGTEYYAFFTTL
jgi:hypothetical protein